MTAAEPSVRDTPRAAASARGDGLLLELSGVSKFFPGVVALDGVDFDLRPGEVHVLFGENGAGKSTLINIIAGTYAPDAGEFRFRGEGIGRFTPHTARMMGISPMFQDCDARAGAEIIAELGFDLHPDRKVGRLSRAHQQMVEIVKALLADVRLLILDEPTASLTESEAASLFDLIAKLKASGVGIIYVSHRMREIKQIADRITVLRDGRKITTVNAGAVSETELVELMTGRKIGVLFPRIDHRPGKTLLEVERLTLADGAVNEVSFYARAGEITGIAGLVGCGKSELVRAVYGLETIASGEIRVGGRAAPRPTPFSSLQAGLCYFPSDRVAEGLALGRPLRLDGGARSAGVRARRPAAARGRAARRPGDRRKAQTASAAH